VLFQSSKSFAKERKKKKSEKNITQCIGNEHFSSEETINEFRFMGDVFGKGTHRKTIKRDFPLALLLSLLLLFLSKEGRLRIKKFFSAMKRKRDSLTAS
jgi:hypothetical protein